MTFLPSLSLFSHFFVCWLVHVLFGISTTRGVTDWKKWEMEGKRSHMPLTTSRSEKHFKMDFPKMKNRNALLRSSQGQERSKGQRKRKRGIFDREWQAAAKHLAASPDRLDTFPFIRLEWSCRIVCLRRLTMARIKWNQTHKEDEKRERDRDNFLVAARSDPVFSVLVHPVWFI